MKAPPQLPRLTAIALLLGLRTSLACARDPLPSWNDTAPKKAITSFVEKVTNEGSPDFVPVPERIAVFDNDGTLWAEQPLYFQFLFVMDRVQAMAPQHPEWKETEPFASLLREMRAVAAQGEKGALELMAVTHTGMTTEDFAKNVHDWITTAKHPESGRLYTEMVYHRCWSCSPTFAPMDSKLSSCRGEAWSSCALLRRGPTASHQSRS